MLVDKYEGDFDLSRVIAKTLYFGFAVNIVVPMVGLFACYYYYNNHFIDNQVGDLANTLFYVFGFLSLSKAGLALWWFQNRMHAPMVRSAGTFEQDLTTAIVARSKPIFILISTINMYGFLYFILTGRFQETVFFVVFSFLVFQIVRPRYGSVRKIVQRQRNLIEDGTFIK